MKPAKRPLGLYLHIPFCRSKCVYCDFYSLAGREGEMDRYCRALTAHLAETAPRAAGCRVDTVYCGGGTPSLLGARRLGGLLRAVKKHYDLAAEAECTFEANPESCQDVRALRQLRRAGFNRVSLGLQSAHDGELRLLGRIHTFAQGAAAVAAARKAGFQNLSLDLMYGLPGQDLAGWLDTLERTVALEPEHLSCYGLKPEEGTPLWEGRDALPGDEAQAEMYLAAVERLERAGYGQYEISNFARPGFESRHNLKYWRLEEYAGFGPGAHSDFGGVRYAYGRDLEGYIRGVLEGGLEVSEAQTLAPEERDTEYIMLALRTREGLDGPTFQRRYRQRFEPLARALAPMAAAGLAEETAPGRWRLTPRGFLVSNAVIRRLWEALEEEKRRRAEAKARGDYRIL